MTKTLGFTGKVHDKTYADPGLFKAALMRTGLKRPGVVAHRPVPRLCERQFTDAAELHQIHDFEPGADHVIRVRNDGVFSVRNDGVFSVRVKVQVWAKAPGNGVWMVDAEGRSYWVHLKTGAVWSRADANADLLGRLAS